MSRLGVICPFCESADIEPVGEWGGQLITSQVRCRACNTYFETIRREFDAAADAIQPEVDAAADPAVGHG